MQDLVARFLADFRFRERLAGPLAAKFSTVGAADDAIGAVQSGCASIQQNEPSSDSTLVLTPLRFILARWKSTSSKAWDSGSSPIRVFKTSTPAWLRTTRGSVVRARRASVNSAGLQWACISIIGRLLIRRVRVVGNLFQPREQRKRTPRARSRCVAL